MKLLMVLSRFPLPARKGDKLRAWEQIKGLSRQFEIHLVCMADEEPDPEDLKQVMAYVQTIKIFTIPLWKRIPGFLTALFTGIPFQVAYFSSARMRRYITQTLHQEKISVCYTQLIRLGRTVPMLPQVRYFLDYMDALSAGMKSRIPESSGLMKVLYRWEAERLARYELRLVSQYDAFSAITQADARLLPKTGSKPLLIIPNGVSERYFQTRLQPEPRFGLLFTGNMGYFPNVKAATYLIQEIFSLLQEDYPALTVCLAGTDPSEKVKALASSKVIVTGYVEDMRTVMGDSKIFVAPLFTGSGLQNKLLESMAAGLPVITTPLANEALGAQPGESILVCSTALEFAQAISRLLKHPELAESIGKAGQVFVQKHYAWDASNDKLGLFLKALGKEKI
jgi:sugar transferase (PEP-CTERM/EpsH1 system associated)